MIWPPPVGGFSHSASVCPSGVQAPPFLRASVLLLPSAWIVGLPRRLSGKESACSAGADGDTGSLPGSGRSPGGGPGSPPQCFCLENLGERRVWRATAHGVGEPDAAGSLSHAWVVLLQGPSLVLPPEASARVSFPQEVFPGHPDRQHPHLSHLPPVTPSRVVVLLTPCSSV